MNCNYCRASSTSWLWPKALNSLSHLAKKRRMTTRNALAVVHKRPSSGHRLLSAWWNERHLFLILIFASLQRYVQHGKEPAIVGSLESSNKFFEVLRLSCMLTFIPTSISHFSFQVLPLTKCICTVTIVTPLLYGRGVMNSSNKNANDAIPAKPKRRRPPGKIISPLKYTNDIVNL